MANKIYSVQMPDGSSIDVELPEGRRDDAVLVAYEIYNRNKNRDFVDKAYFDEETGINIQSIRAKLGLAENPEEQENVLRSYVGSKGFTRDSRGRIAITPVGQQRLISRGMMRPDQRSEKNIIVDERGFSLGDFSDFSGIVGPVVGAISALTPGGKVLSFLNRFGIKDRFGRTVAAAIGSGAGEAGEEVVELGLGQQQEKFGDIARNISSEAGLGALGQGVGEAIGAGYRSLLGMKAPAEEVALLREPLKGIVDPLKVQNLERIRGRKLTPEEIKLEATVYGVPSQRAFQRSFPGRIQSAGETVVGKQDRMRGLIDAELAEGRQLLEKVGSYNFAFDDMVSKVDAGTLTKEAFENQLKTLRQERLDAIKQITNLTKQSTKAINAGALTGVPGTGEAGEVVKDTLETSLRSFMNGAENQYARVEDMLFKPQRLTRGSVDIEARLVVDTSYFEKIKARVKAKDKVEITANAFDELREQQQGRFIQEAQKEFDDFIADKTVKDIVFEEGSSLRLFLNKNPHIAQRLNIPSNQIDDFIANASEEQLTRINNTFLRDLIGDTAQSDLRFINLASPEAKIIDFKPIKNRLNKVVEDNQILNEALKAGADISDIQALLEMGDSINFTQLMKFKSETAAIMRARPALPDALSKELAALGDKADDMLTDLARGGDLAKRLFAEGADVADIQKIVQGSQLLKAANAYYKSGMDAFEDTVVQSMLKNFKDRGGLDVDQVFDFVVKPERPELVNRFLQGFRKEADDATRSIMDPETSQAIKNRLGGELLKKEIQAASNFDGTIDPVKFARRLNNYGSTLDALFDNPAQLRTLIKDMGQVSFKVDEDILLKLSDNPSDLIKGYRSYLNKQQEIVDLKKSQLFRDITNAPDAEIVDVLLKPRNAREIEKVFNVVGPERAQALREESMRSLINKVIKNSDAGDFKDVFNPEIFRTTLDSIGDESLTAFFGKDLTKALRDYQRRLTIINAARS